MHNYDANLCPSTAKQVVGNFVHSKESWREILLRSVLLSKKIFGTLVTGVTRIFVYL